MQQLPLWRGADQEIKDIAEKQSTEIWHEYSEGRLTAPEALKLSNVINEKLVRSLEFAAVGK